MLDGFDFVRPATFDRFRAPCLDLNAKDLNAKVLLACERGYDVVVAGHGVAGVGGWHPTTREHLLDHLDFVRRHAGTRLEVVAFADLAEAYAEQEPAEHIE